ncbi:hypothetical protein ACWFRJ_39850 [Streptomyces sp. NPDC055239]
MSLLNRIKFLLGGGSSAQSPVSPDGGQSAERPVGELPAAPPPGTARSEGAGLKNSIARGAAEGTAREAVRKIFEVFLDD